MANHSKKTYILTIIVCLLPIIAGAIFYNRIPDEIATHWDFDGNPNGWSSKNTGLFALPGILLIINILFPIILKTDPKITNLSAKIKDLVQWTIPAVSLFASSITLISALGITVNVQLIAPIFMGLLFIIIGNYLPKTSQSYTVGIKLPWTLNSEINWNKTHRLAGFLWVICGLAMIISAFLPTPIMYVCLIIDIVIMVFIPMIYSYILYATKKDIE